MGKSRFRFSPAVYLALAGLALVSLACGAAGTAAQEAVVDTEIVEVTRVPEEEPLSPEPDATLEAIATPRPTQAPIDVAPAILETRRLTLEWPPTIRAGDSDVVRLTLEVDAEGKLTPTAMIEGHETRGETVYIPDVYATHNVFAEARLDMAGVEVSPNELTSQSLLRGRSVTFYWSVSPKEVGTYRGTVWLYLRFLPIEAGVESQRALSAQVIEINAINLIGLGGTAARVLGGIGAVVGSLLGLDDLVSLVGKLRKRS